MPTDTMEILTDVDPFNHGTTTIHYEELPEAKAGPLISILQDRWRISGVKSISRQATGTEKSSNNYKVLTTSDQRFLLKRSHTSTASRQELIDRSIAFLHGKGVPTVVTLATVDGSSFHQTPEGMFCVQDFIEGQHFDGSQTELTAFAVELARLHKVMASIPYIQEIETQKKARSVCMIHRQWTM